MKTDYASHYTQARVPQDLYDSIITNPLALIKKENSRIDPIGSQDRGGAPNTQVVVHLKPPAPPVKIPSGMQTGIAIPEDKIQRPVKTPSGVEMGMAIPDNKVVFENDLNLVIPYEFESQFMKNYLLLFAQKWSDTATYRFLGIAKSPWPLPTPNVKLEEGSYDEKFLKMILGYPPGRLRVPPMDFASFERKNTKWREAFKRQFFDYCDWIDLNVRAQDKPHYSPPGKQLKDLQGVGIVGPDEKPLLNVYPDYMIDRGDTRGPLSLSGLVSITMIPIDQAAKFIFGDDWVDFLDSVAQKVWESVKKALKVLYQVVTDVIKAVLPTVWPILLALGGGLIVFFGVETYASEKIKILAQ